MKKIALLLSFVCLSGLIMAKSVDLITAQTVAKNYFKFFNPTVDAELKTNVFYTDKTTAFCFYVFDFAPTGFIVVAADDRCTPILGYSTEVNYTEPKAGTSVKYWLDSKSTEIEYIVKNDLAADAVITKQWSDGISNSFAKAKSGSSVSPLLANIKWDQGSYYNYYCPSDASSVIGNGKVPTGCVATSMAQILKYWDYPWQGNSSHSYNASGYGSQSANFGTTMYDFKDMKNTANSISYLQIATLMYHCGVAVNMGYGATGSGAQMTGNGYPSAELAYKNYFRYNSSKVKSYSQSSFSTTQWINIIEAELNLRRPIQYDGFDPSNEGHAWVCDGYNTSDYLHMNWGWGGTDNGYFQVGTLNPSSLGTGGGTGGGFNAGNDIIIGIEPLGDPYEGSSGNNIQANGYAVPLNFVNDSAIFLTTFASIHTINDTDYYAFNLPAGYNYSFTSSLWDKYNYASMGNYTEDAQLLFSQDGGANWNGIYDDTVSAFNVHCANTVYYKVFPFNNLVLGSYRLNVRVKRTSTDCSTGINDIAASLGVTIFPNPANDKLEVITQNDFTGKINLLNSLGQIVLTQSVENKSAEVLDVSNLTNGIYFVQISTKQGVVNQKVAVNH